MYAVGKSDAETQNLSAVGKSDLLAAETQNLSAVGKSDLLDVETQNLSAVGKSDLLNIETQKMDPTISNQTQNSLLIAETQPITASCQKSEMKYDKIRSKMSDSDIMIASTQTLLSKLNDSEIVAGPMTSTPLLTDSLILAASTQVNLHQGEKNLEDDNDDDLLLAATQPVFKLPNLPSKNKSTEQIVETETESVVKDYEKDILEAETSALIPGSKKDEQGGSSNETAPVIEASDILEADTIALINPQEDLQAEIAPFTSAIDDNEDDEDLVEDQTQCKFSFDEIKENLEKAEKELMAMEDIPKSSLRNLFPIGSNDDNESNCSEDLLATDDENEIDEDIANDDVDDTLRIKDSQQEDFIKTSVENVSMVEATQPSRTNTGEAMEAMSTTSVENISKASSSTIPSVVVTNPNDDTKDGENQEEGSRPSTPVGRNTSAEKSLCLELDATVDNSPVFKKKNSSSCSQSQCSQILSSIEADVESLIIGKKDTSSLRNDHSKTVLNESTSRKQVSESCRK